MFVVRTEGIICVSGVGVGVGAGLGSWNNAGGDPWGGGSGSGGSGMGGWTDNGGDAWD